MILIRPRFILALARVQRRHDCLKEHPKCACVVWPANISGCDILALKLVEKWLGEDS